MTDVTTSDILWATLNKLVRDSMNYDEHDPSFEIAPLATNQLFVNKDNVRRVCWECIDSLNSGGLPYYRGGKSSSIKKSFEYCLSEIRKDEHYKDDALLKQRFDDSLSVKNTEYDKLLTNAIDFYDKVDKWKQINKTTSAEISHAEGEITNILVSGRIGGEVSTAAVTGNLTLQGTVDVTKMEDGEKPGSDIWMRLTWADTATLPIDRSNWFDYDCLTGCMCDDDLSQKIKDKLKNYWNDPDIEIETGMIKKPAGIFRYIPTQLILWQGIRVEFSFTAGKGLETQINAIIDGSLSVMGINNVGGKINGKAHVTVTSAGTDINTYTFDSGEIENNPFIAGVIVEPCILPSNECHSCLSLNKIK